MADVKVAALGADGLQEVSWDACDELIGGALVASPGDALGRGIALSVTRAGKAADLTGAHAHLVWRHRETRRRGCVPFSADDASAGRFSVFYPAAMASEEGTVEAQVMLSWGERALSSRTFTIHVERVLAGDGGDEGGFAMFVKAIKRLEGMTLDAVDAAGAVDGLHGLAAGLPAARLRSPRALRKTTDAAPDRRLRRGYSFQYLCRRRPAGAARRNAPRPRCALKANGRATAENARRPTRRNFIPRRVGLCLRI